MIGMKNELELPTLEELKRINLENAEFMYEIQQKAQKAYSKGLAFQKDKKWFLNGYSIHPDALEIGFDKYKDLIMKHGDGRNEYLYCELKERLKKNLADWLGSQRPADIALGINATTFIVQILSHYWGTPVKVLTTDQEFYGTVRVLNRLKEIEGNVITEIKMQPFKDFPERLLEEANRRQYDLIILSHTPFKSANMIDDLDELIIKLKEKVDKIVIDGSAAFGNVPVDKMLGSVMDEIYYIGGVYKFIGAGEGFSFMSLPKNCKDRPVMTGWLFGDYRDENHYFSKPLHYESDGDRYANSTLECSIWLRTNEIIEYFNRENFSVEKKNQYTTILQDYMVKKIDENDISFLSSKNLVSVFGKWRPLQTCFEMKDQVISAKDVVCDLEKENIIADYRGSILRLCPAVYHTIYDIDLLISKIKLIDTQLLSKVK